MRVISSRLICLFGALVMCVTAAHTEEPVGTPLQLAQNDPPQAEQPAGDGRDTQLELREFMRRKLVASNKILEGLVTEDPQMIQEAAKDLNTLSRAEKWRVRNDVMYRQFSSEFQRITEQLAASAEKGNFDQAALKWMDVTMSCIECHRFVRGVMVARETE